jgi:hypothetical protein
VPVDPALRRLSSRQSTVTSTQMAVERQQAKAERDRQTARPVRAPEVRLTQVQHLALAAETEKLNVASLDAFMRREEERKRAPKRARTCVAGRLCAHSLQPTWLMQCTVGRRG